MKKLIIILLLFCPIFINADCDREKQKVYASYAQDISYETEFSKGQNRFTVKLYNVIDEMTVKYDNKVQPIKNNEVVINGVKEGTKMQIHIYGKDGCTEASRIIYIDQPYYNEYFGSTLCHGYEGKITYCTHKFTNIKMNEDLIKRAIDNYDNILPQEKDPEPEPELTTLQKISKFARTWGVRIILVLLTSFFTNWYFNDKYIKVKHKL